MQEYLVCLYPPTFLAFVHPASCQVIRFNYMPSIIMWVSVKLKAECLETKIQADKSPD